jgi:predicted RNase H-like HicB family nuclease
MAKNKKDVRRNDINEDRPVIAEMATSYSAVIRKDGKWWIGWIQEIPGVNSQGSSRASLLDNLKSALKEATAVPRHTEISNILARKICRDLGISDP